VADREPARFAPSAEVKALSRAAQALVDVIRRSPLSEIPALERGVFNDLIASGEPPSLADILQMLIPAQDPETAVLDFIPGSLFGIGRRARRGPFFHGTEEGRVESILDKGFLVGSSSELNLPGTSLTRDPMVAQEMFAGNQLADHILGVDVPESMLEEIRNLSPSEFLRSAEILEEMGAKNFPTAVNKPSVFFRESESFFPRGEPRSGRRFDAPAMQLGPRRMSHDEELLQEFQDVVENRGTKQRVERLKASQMLSKGVIFEGRIAKDLAAQLRGPRSQVARNVGTAIEMLDDVISKVRGSPLSALRVDLATLRKMRGRLVRVEDSFRQVQFTGRLVDEVNGAVMRFRTKTKGGIRETQLNAIVEKVEPTAARRIDKLDANFVEVRFHSPSRFKGPDDSSKLVSFRIPSSAETRVGDTLQSVLDKTRRPLDDVTRFAQQELQDIIKQLETGRLKPPPPKENRLQRIREIMERDIR
jgi:hypothetical protein